MLLILPFFFYSRENLIPQMDFWSYCQSWTARILRCHFTALLFKLYRTTPNPKKRNLVQSPMGCLEDICVTPSQATKKNQLPRAGWNLCFSRIPLLLFSLKRLGRTTLSSFIHHFIPGSYREFDQKRIPEYKPATPANFITSMLFVCLIRAGEGWRKIKSYGKTVLTAQLLCCGLLSSWCNRRSGACICFSWHSQRWCL